MLQKLQRIGISRIRETKREIKEHKKQRTIFILFLVTAMSFKVNQLNYSGFILAYCDS